ncbi:MAG: type II CRISPR RNA-guided endonuclease Cas9 [Bacteroidales bacterium]|jgi:CRISPR-associated endonuclease Csn1|nr:type II CRISPR RNA-guided endonuclease Cas9 [Bacteroidales bacterium]
MTKILGLDLGTNSIGWALIDQNFTEKQGTIIGMGSRIIPMDQGTLGEFERGNSVSQTKVRTGFRSVRRLRERHLLRRARLHTVLNILGFLPEHFANAIDFEIHYGQFRDESEPKLVYKPTGKNDKPEFIFKDSFNEMMKDFSRKHPALVEGNLKVPYDWTIYYLRKKALTDRIEKQELAWLLLNFNQKRGYYQLRGEEEENKENELVEFYALQVVDVVDSGDRKGKDEIWYNVILENGWVYRRTSKTLLDWIGKIKEFIVTTDLNDDRTVKKDKDGKEKRSFRAPKPDDWTLIKKKTEFEIGNSNKTVGCYIYDTLLEDPSQKIKGKLVRTIERKFYKEELRLILEKQKEFHSELHDRQLYNICIQKLYKSNESHKNSLNGKDFTHLFIDDIIFFQRPLRSKKSLINDCRYEKRVYKSKDGTIVMEPVKCIAKSHPRYQEFRLWQFLQNLKIYRKDAEVDGKILPELDVTSEFLRSEEDWVALFDWLNAKKDIQQEIFLKYPPFNLKKNIVNYRWNYVEDKTYPANETRAQILSKIEKIKNVSDGFLTREIEESLWHILYSVEDNLEIIKALKTFADRYGLDEEFVEHFKKFPRFKKDYGAYSAKAIKKLLPLMRRGKYWNEDEISQVVKNRINAISERLISVEHDRTKITEITDDDIPKQVLKSFIECQNPMQALNTYQACYAVYGRHSEEGEITRWKNPEEVDHFLKTVFRQLSLRNPIVEQVIVETLHVVKDIWNEYGNGKENFFDEIHIEMGREMKNPADRRKKMTEQISANENTNVRIKALLAEMSQDSAMENVRPYSHAQQDILKIYEDGVLNSGLELPEDILKISRNAQPSKTELIRYKLWLEQKYRSPYTGEVIPLGKLFTTAYEIEHIIPQSRYFDDSLNNKVICEAEVNKDKDNCTGYEYIKANSGKIIQLSMGKTTRLFTVDAYQDYVKNHFLGNRGKMKRLLMDDIPEGFIARQLNDTRYISKFVKNLLSNIVREEGEQETTSRNVCASNGSITSKLKQDWGLNDVWDKLISPRFIRLNQLTNTNQFGEWVNKNGKNIFQNRVPLELQKGFSKKRIDHRHHAIDALVIACATRNHINYLNNEYAKSDFRYDLRSKLCFKNKTDGNDHYKWSFCKPWDCFINDVKDKLETIVVSFKQNTRVINKTVNWYQKWQVNEDGKLQKVFIRQDKGDHWAIRKPMHKDTVAGAVSLRFKKHIVLSAAIDKWEMIVDKLLKEHIKALLNEGNDKKAILKYFKSVNNSFKERDVSRVEVYYFDNDNVATRVSVDESFTSSVIEKITDSGIRKILLKHLAKYNEYRDDKSVEHPELAFSPDGLDELNKNIKTLNDGKEHKPIGKVRKFESKGNKFRVGYRGNKKSKFVEADKGTNLFFAIYIDKNKKRSYESIPLSVVIERQKQGLSAVPEENDKGFQLLFYLSPNDLVYVPSIEEKEDLNLCYKDALSKLQTARIFKMLSSSGTQSFFIRNDISTVIWNKVEFSPLNKMERSMDGVMIKGCCWKIKTDRLGNIVDIIGRHNT